STVNRASRAHPVASTRRWLETRGRWGKLRSVKSGRGTPRAAKRRQTREPYSALQFRGFKDRIARPHKPICRPSIRGHSREFRCRGKGNGPFRKQIKKILQMQNRIRDPRGNFCPC